MKITKKQIKKQTWRYFWKQKLVEVVIFLESVFLLTYLASIFNKWNWLNNKLYAPTDTITFWTGFVSLFIFLVSISLCLLCLGLIFMLILFWINSNWKKAKRRAKAKLKKNTQSKSSTNGGKK